jgi:hypothetical protein
MTYWIHIANVLFLLSYLVRDILWLRVLTVVASSTLLPFYVARSVYEALAWNSLFIAINIVQIVRLLVERRPVRLSAEEQLLYQALFSGLTRRDFLRLAQVGSWREAAPDEVLVSQGERNVELIVVIDGAVDVHVGERRVTTLEGRRFVGEMSFLTGDGATASVRTSARTRYLAWPRDVLTAFLKRHPHIKTQLQLAIGTELARKLQPVPQPA